MPPLPWWPSYAAYLCRSWNRRHDGDERLERLSIGFMLRTGGDDAEEIRHVVFLEQTCVAP